MSVSSVIIVVVLPYETSRCHVGDSAGVRDRNHDDLSSSTLHKFEAIR
jgi:hypothetical protein